MEITRVEQAGVGFLEGVADEAFVKTAADINRLIEASFDEATNAALLYAANLPADFYDISSGVAGEVLQKLRNYNVRLALVCPPGSVQFSSRFRELVDDERRGSYFGLFAQREDAVNWLAAHT